MLALKMNQDTETIRKSLSTFKENTRGSLIIKYLYVENIFAKVNIFSNLGLSSPKIYLI